MHIQDIFANWRTTFSFEFMPPKNDVAAEQLFGTIAELETLHPSFRVRHVWGGRLHAQVHA